MRLHRFVFFLLLFVAGNCAFAFATNSLQEKISPTEEKIVKLLEEANKLKYDDNKRGIKLIKEAEQLALKGNHEKKLGEVYTAYGSMHYVDGSYDVSMQMHLKALKIHEKYQNHFYITRSLNGIGLVQMGLNQYEECIATFEKCAALNLKHKNLGAAGRNYFNISVAEIELKEFEKASKGFKKALQFALLDKDVDTEHMAYSRLGEVKLFLNQIDSSLYYYEKLFSHPVAPSKWEKTYSYAGLANTYKKMACLDEAEKYALMSFQFAKELDAKWDLERSTAILAEVYAAKKDMQNAYKYLSLHRVYNDSLFNQEKVSEINYQQLKRKEAENLQLQSEKKAALEKEKTSRVINYSFVLFIAFLLGILFLLKRNIRLKDKFNQELEAKNTDIENQRAIIASQNEILEGLNKSKNRLFSILAHDLRTPINSIFQVLELQQQGDFPKEVEGEIFAQLLKQVEGTSTVLNNLLHWANTQMDGTVVHLEDINLTDIVNISVDSFYMEAFTKKITINNLDNQEKHLINADLGQARIIVQNVLANAIKFTPVAGSVDVFYSDDHQYQNLHIVDYGLGMSKNLMEEIINYDKRMHSEMGTAMEKGTGLGLLLVKQFLVNNKGKMDIKSEEDKRTEFIISFLKAK